MCILLDVIASDGKISGLEEKLLEASKRNEDAQGGKKEEWRVTHTARTGCRL